MITILIVDDKHHNRSAYKLALEDGLLEYNNREPNIKILLAKDEFEGITLINEENIDVVITDLSMKNDVAGISVLTAAKQKDPLTMVIIITANGKKLDKKIAYGIGAFDCLEKSEANVKMADELVYKTKNAINFKETTLKLIETNRTMGALKKYFDPSVFGKIQDNPYLLLPKNKFVTLVFWDIRGFSALCEILKVYPDLIAGFLKEYFEAASKVIFNNHGVLDKFIGDGVMAIFGAFNQKHDDDKTDALDAVNAAVELKKDFRRIEAKWQKLWDGKVADSISIGLGCGIHSGEAVVGNLGTDLRDHFTAIGPHVNLASRIESSAVSGQIRISKTTKSYIEANHSLKFVETLTNIKNIRGNFDIFEIVD